MTSTALGKALVRAIMNSGIELKEEVAEKTIELTPEQRAEMERLEVELKPTIKEIEGFGWVGDLWVLGSIGKFLFDNNIEESDECFKLWENTQIWHASNGKPETYHTKPIPGPVDIANLKIAKMKDGKILARKLPKYYHG